MYLRLPTAADRDAGRLVLSNRLPLRIGVFDSGLGGLSVLKPIRQALPAAELLYVADSAHLPYGNKSDRYLEQRVLAISQFLVSQGCRALVVACNTATAAAVAATRQQYALPVIGLEPAIKPAVLTSQTKVVGVLATEFTVQSARFAALKQRFDGQAQILVQACPGLVEQVEAGRLHDPVTAQLLHAFIDPLVAAGVDRLVLGCTHYPFLTPLLQQLLPAGVEILDTGGAVTRELLRRLGPLDAGDSERSLLGNDWFWTSGEPARLNPVLASLWSPSAVFQPLQAEESRQVSGL